MSGSAAKAKTKESGGETIVSPRVYALRQQQAKDGVDLRGLKAEQQGTAPLTFMHHVSKIIEGKIESYRVRICRTCSGLSMLLELGSYADVESALLVNDVHEILQGRTKQLHLLVPNDMSYVKMLTVRRRGGLHDHPLINVLQERLMKTLSKNKNKKDEDDGDEENESGGKNKVLNVGGAQGGIQGNMSMGSATSIGNRPPYGTGAAGGHQIKSNNTLSMRPADVSQEWDSFPSNGRQGSTLPMQSPVDSRFGIGNGNGTIPGPDTMQLAGGLHAENSTRMYQNGTGSYASLPGPSGVGPNGNGKGAMEAQSSSYGRGRDNYDDYARPQPQHVPHGAPWLSAGSDSRAGPESSIMNTAGSLDYHRDAPMNLSSSVNYPSLGNDRSDTSSNGKNGQRTSSRDDAGTVEMSATTRSHTDESSPATSSKPPDSSPLRQHFLAKQIKTNLKGFTSVFLLWKFFDSETNVENMLADFGQFLSDEILNAGDKFPANVDELTIAAKSHPTAVKLLGSMDKAWCLPRGEIFNTVAAVCPGEPAEIQAMLRLLSGLLNQDAPSIYEYRDAYQGALLEIGSNVRQLLLRASVTNESAQLPSPCLNKEEFGSLEQFIRITNYSAANFEYALRLSVWDAEIPERQDAEVKLQGLYGQISTRTLLAVSMSNELKTLFFAVQNWVHSRTQGANGGDGAGGAASTDAKESEAADREKFSDSVRMIKTLLQRTVLATVYLSLSLATSALAVQHLCLDFDAITQCLRVYNSISPLLSTLDNNYVSQLFQQRHVDLMTACLKGLEMGPDGVVNSLKAQEESLDKTDIEMRVIAFSLGTEMIRQTRKCFLTFPRDLTGPAAMVYYETALRAYTSIFLLSLALGESDFLLRFGYTVFDLFSTAYDALVCMYELIQKLSCSVMSTHTIVSMHSLVNACLLHAGRFPESSEKIYKVVRACRLVLWSATSRFVLAKMYLESISVAEEKQFSAMQAIMDRNRERRVIKAAASAKGVAGGAGGAGEKREGEEGEEGEDMQPPVKVARVGALR